MRALNLKPILPEFSDPAVWEGIWVVDKPAGMTSNKVLQGLRKTARIQKMGYLGTLDPIATGVLPICVGWATKIIPFIPNHPKGYRAVMILGKKTDTQDGSGQVISSTSQPLPDRKRVEEVILEFIGSQEQVPPSFSALKYKGKPLYHWARRGIAIVKPPRQITIDSIEILGMEGERVTFEMFCSPGTYVRTLCNDVGKRLGCSAYLDQLQRIQSGPFTLAQAHSLEKIQKASFGKEIEALKIPVNKILHDFPHIQVDWPWKETIKQGGFLTSDSSSFPWPEVEPGTPIFVTSPQGELWAIYQKVGQSKQIFKPIRVII
ncbi:MAG: tRNA pseudouridine(55) synthase TruB [Desulfobacca sp.]|nr:tRNA pseudouridine(55) synthase TruB [Desulfobacca sp.]